MEAVTRDLCLPPVTADEESLRRNTDCIYFLASPLTCIKGTECVYRHSEAARMNPRDCRFWLNGNCLNPKCAFRHPPLDGLVGTSGAPSAGSSLPPHQSLSSTQLPPSYTAISNLGKQVMPCYYFQKGLCLKGDRCPFMHRPQPIGNPLPQPQAPKVVESVTVPWTLKKAFSGLKSCTQQKIVPRNIVKPVELPLTKAAMKSKTAQQKNGLSVKRNIMPPMVLNDEYLGYQDLCNNPHGYDPYGRVQKQYIWEQHRDSSKRISERASIQERRGFLRAVSLDQESRASVQERRGFLRAESLDQIGKLDLRHQLSKRRRLNGSRSAVTPNYCGDYWMDGHDHHIGEQRNQGHSQSLFHESSIKNRLQDRIMVPGISLPDRDNDSHPKREMDRGRSWGRLLPSKPPVSSHQGRHQEQIKPRSQEDFIREGSNIRGPLNRRIEVDSNSSDFAGPRSLTELKGVKKKRELEAADSGNGNNSGSGEEISSCERGENLTGSSRMIAITETVQPFEPQKEANYQEVEPRSPIACAVRRVEDDEEGLISIEGNDVAHEDEFTYAQEENELEMEDEMMIDDEMEDQELENFDQGDGESGYEQVDGGDFKTEEDENVDQEENFDDEDGDDFATKISAMFA